MVTGSPLVEADFKKEREGGGRREVASRVMPTPDLETLSAGSFR